MKMELKKDGASLIYKEVCVSDMYNWVILYPVARKVIFSK